MKTKWILLASILVVSQAPASNLLTLLEEDQAVRNHLQTLPAEQMLNYMNEVILPGDKIRLEQVKDILKSSANLSSEELYAAAMIMQHGGEAKHYKLAMELSQKSATLNPDNKNASWLSCAAEDRYLLNVGESQVWGTQLRMKMNLAGTFQIYRLENFDKNARTDEQRSKCGIPTLAEIESRLERMSKLKNRNAQYRLWKTGT